MQSINVSQSNKLAKPQSILSFNKNIGFTYSPIVFYRNGNKNRNQHLHIKTESNVTNTSPNVTSLLSPGNEKKTSFKYPMNGTSRNKVSFDSFKTCPDSKNLKLEHSLIRKISSRQQDRIPGPFEVNEEDKIFNELSIFKKKAPKKKAKVIEKTTKSIHQLILSRIYQIPTKVTKRIEKVKRNKDDYPLAKYQKHLILTASNHFSKDSIQRLNRSFMKIWNMCNSKIYEKNYQSVKLLEEYEEMLIAKLQRHQNSLKNIIKTSNDCDFGEKIMSLPEVTFSKVFK